MRRSWFVSAGSILSTAVLGLIMGSLARPLSKVSPAARPTAEREHSCVQQIAPEADASCDEIELATRWCEARLATLDAPTARLTLSAPRERDRFARGIDNAFASCGVPAKPVVADCSEPPCVISVRLEEQKAVEDAIRSCPALAALGFTEPIVQQWPIHCPDGTTETMGLVTASVDLQEVVEQLLPQKIREAESDGDNTFWAALFASYYGYGQVGRRAEQLSRQWPCGG